MKPVRSPKKGQAPFIIFHSNFRVKNRTLIQIRVPVFFYFSVSSASVLELAGTVTLILYLLQSRLLLPGFCPVLYMHRLDFHKHPHTWALVRQLQWKLQWLQGIVPVCLMQSHSGCRHLHRFRWIQWPWWNEGLQNSSRCFLRQHILCGTQHRLRRYLLYLHCHIRLGVRIKIVPKIKRLNLRMVHLKQCGKNYYPGWLNSPFRANFFRGFSYWGNLKLKLR